MKVKNHEFDKESLNKIYQDSFTLVMPYLILEGQQRKKLDEAEMKRGMDGLFLVLAHANSWPTHWVLGKCYQALGKHEESYQHFLASHQSALDEQDVMRELCLECLRTKRLNEAAYYAKAAHEFAPDDFSLWSNMAACYLFTNQLDEAEKWAEKTLEKIDDPSAANILKIAKMVREGGEISLDDIDKIISIEGE